MSFTKKGLRNFAASFAVVAAGSAAFAQDDVIANDNAVAAGNDYSFSCDQASYAGQNLSLPDLAENIMPGNVFIQASREMAMPSFVPGPEGEDAPTMRAPGGATGSGFIIDANEGYIVTNSHVVMNQEGTAENQAYTVTLYDPNTVNNQGIKFDAELVGMDGTDNDQVDIAVLKIDAGETPLTCVHLGDSDEVRLFDPVFAIGNGLGQTFAGSKGVVSNVMRNIGDRYHEMIQTDATINRGNSGGALYNMDGEVIGVNTSILSPSGGSIGIGFAIPSNTVAKIADRLITDGEVIRGWLGVGIQDVDEATADRLQGATENRGVLVTNISPNGPAAAAGIQSDDIILGIDGTPTNNATALVRGVGDIRPGDTTSFTILRNGQTIDLDVEIALKTPEAQQELQQGNNDDGGGNNDPFMLTPPDEDGDSAPDDDTAPNGDDTTPDSDATPNGSDVQPNSAPIAPLPQPGLR